MVLLIIVRLRHLQNIYVHVYVSSVLEQNMYKTGTKLIYLSHRSPFISLTPFVYKQHKILCKDTSQVIATR